jgi:hypothetical protein
MQRKQRQVTGNGVKKPNVGGATDLHASPDGNLGLPRPMIPPGPDWRISSARIA